MSPVMLSVMREQLGSGEHWAQVFTKCILNEWAMGNKGGMPMPVDICPGAMEPIWDWAGQAQCTSHIK